MSGDVEKTYPITVQATLADGKTKTTGTFNLTIKNPCIDPDHHEIVSRVSLPKTELKYRLTDPALEVEAFSLL